MFIASNLAISIDGKIAPANRSFCPLGTPLDRQIMRQLRGQHQVVFFGAETLRTFKKPCLALGKNPHPINAVLSHHLKGISPNWPFFKSTQIKRMLFVSASCPQEQIKKFEKTCQIFVLPTASAATQKTNTAEQIIKILKAQKIKSLIVEGGGGVMWEFAQKNLIDRYYVTLTPKIVGGQMAPTLVDGVGFEPQKILSLKLVESKVVKNEIYLIYEKNKSKKKYQF